ncbi:hypothetical protein HDE76_000740 [Rhodanobacter sp. ANJX3]|nr:hypothetical protein [Rhodanobacter sp. ANJX3]
MQERDEETFCYRGFLLICVPCQMQCGGWSASAAVVNYSGPHDVVVADTPGDLTLISKKAAVEYAQAWGKQWVDDSLKASDPAESAH